MGLGRAIFKLFSGGVYFVTAGFINLEKYFFRNNPGVIGVKFDSLIEARQKDGTQQVEALTGLVKVQEGRKQRLEKLKHDLATTEKKEEAYRLNAMKRAQALNGNKELLNSDAEYLKFKNGALDYQSTIKSKKENIATLETEITNSEKAINNAKTVVQNTQRDVIRLGEKKHEAIAEVLGAKQAREAAKSQDVFNRSRSAELERELDDIVNDAKASVKVTQELSGLDVEQQDAVILADAERNLASDEFDRLIGVAEASETSTVEVERQTEEKAKLPE